MRTKDNFYLNSFAVWKTDFGYRFTVPNRAADFISESGSRYWYENDYVVRFSDHWGNVASCLWVLDRDVLSVAIYAYCKLSAFFDRASDQEVNYFKNIEIEKHPFANKWIKSATKKELKMLDDAQKDKKDRTASLYDLYAAIESSLSRKPYITMKNLEGSTVCVSCCYRTDFVRASQRKSGQTDAEISVVFKRGTKAEGTVATFVFKSGRPKMISVVRTCTTLHVRWNFTDAVKNDFINSLREA